MIKRPVSFTEYVWNKPAPDHPHTGSR